MDTGLGKFAPISKKKAEEIFKRPFQTNDSNTLGIFCAGEELIIRGSKFRIVSVGRTKMKLRILKS